MKLFVRMSVSLVLGLFAASCASSAAYVDFQHSAGAAASVNVAYNDVNVAEQELSENVMALTQQGQPSASVERRVVQRLVQLSWAASGSLSRQRHKSVHYVRAASFDLRPEGPLAVQVDGEFAGEAGPDAPLRLWADPSSVTVVVPAGANPLFGD